MSGSFRESEQRARRGGVIPGFMAFLSVRYKQRRLQVE